MKDPLNRAKGRNKRATANQHVSCNNFLELPFVNHLLDNVKTPNKLAVNDELGKCRPVIEFFETLGISELILLEIHEAPYLAERFRPQGYQSV